MKDRGLAWIAALVVLFLAWRQRPAPSGVSVTGGVSAVTLGAHQVRKGEGDSATITYTFTVRAVRGAEPTVWTYRLRIEIIRPSPLPALLVWNFMPVKTGLGNGTYTEVRNFTVPSGTLGITDLHLSLDAATIGSDGLPVEDSWVAIGSRSHLAAMEIIASGLFVSGDVSALDLAQRGGGVWALYDRAKGGRRGQ